jgi:hypothetical protein
MRRRPGGNSVFSISRGWEWQQVAQRGGSRPAQSRAHRHLGRSQIDAPRVAPFLQHHPQGLFYFALDLLPECFDRFFLFCLLLEWPQTADLRVGSQKLTSELLESPEKNISFFAL